MQPGVSSPQFAQIFGCLRTADRTKVFKFFAKDSAHRRVDVNEILAVAILTATAFVSVKTRVLFQLYDLDDSMDLSLSETVMMLGSAVRGLSRCTDGAKPSAHADDALKYALADAVGRRRRPISVHASRDRARCSSSRGPGNLASRAVALPARWPCS